MKEFTESEQQKYGEPEDATTWEYAQENYQVSTEEMQKAQELGVTPDDMMDFADNNFEFTPEEIAEAKSLGISSEDANDAWNYADDNDLLKAGAEIKIGDIPGYLEEAKKAEAAEEAYEQTPEGKMERTKRRLETIGETPRSQDSYHVQATDAYEAMKQGDLSPNEQKGAEFVFDKEVKSLENADHFISKEGIERLKSGNRDEAVKTLQQVDYYYDIKNALEYGGDIVPDIWDEKGRMDEAKMTEVMKTPAEEWNKKYEQS